MLFVVLSLLDFRRTFIELSSDFRWMFIEFSFDFHWTKRRTFVQRVFDVRPMCIGLSSNFHLTFIGLLFEVCQTSIGLSLDFYRTFIGLPFNFCSMFIELLSMTSTITVHLHAIFFKLYVLRTYVSNIVFFKSYLVFYIFTKFWGMGQHHTSRNLWFCNQRICD